LFKKNKILNKKTIKVPKIFTEHLASKIMIFFWKTKPFLNLWLPELLKKLSN